MKRAVFLDRDGVINRAFVKQGKPYPPQNREELEILPSVPEALSCLKKGGFFLVVVTNQPDVARGMQKKEVVEEMHRLLLEALPLDAIEVCYDETSPNYKPQPGMLFSAAQKYGIDLKRSFMVGDRWRDIEAGKAAGCPTFLIDYHYAESVSASPDFICSSLLEATSMIFKICQRVPSTC